MCTINVQLVCLETEKKSYKTTFTFILQDNLLSIYFMTEFLVRYHPRAQNTQKSISYLFHLKWWKGAK